MLALLALLGGAGRAQAQGMELSQFGVERADGGVLLTFAVKPTLSHAVEDALRRGVPVHFVAEASLLRYRWYWRNERVARAERRWRVSYQPLTASWRVSVGALNQSFATLAEALAVATRATRWRIAELDQLDADERYELRFAYRLDEDQLPLPMQLDIDAQDDWRLAVERRIPLE